MLTSIVEVEIERSLIASTCQYARVRVAVSATLVWRRCGGGVTRCVGGATEANWGGEGGKENDRLKARPEARRK